MIVLKNTVKKLLDTTLLKPIYVTHCSQTIYQSLIGCVRMWEATKLKIWETRAESVLQILLSIQRPDGGFDIGYEFNFGKIHKVGESTSPELVGLLALSVYEEVFKDERCFAAAVNAVSWIENSAIRITNSKSAVPYAPSSTKKVMIYNGTSFAAAALGRFLGSLTSDESDSLERLYLGFIEYLDGEMSRMDGVPGRFWYYADQSRSDLEPVRRKKIDYYHQMQQVEVHSMAQRVAPNARQLRMIKDAVEHVLAIADKNGILPYTNDPYHFRGYIHVWGFASFVSGLLESAELFQDVASTYRRIAETNLRWLISNSWNEEDYFYPVIDSDGEVRESRYMVRSDAWVFNTLAAATKYIGDGPWADIANRCFRKMEAHRFSGYETHASNSTQRFVRKLIESVVNDSRQSSRQ